MSSERSRIVFCQITYARDAEETVRSVRAALPYVDAACIVTDTLFPMEERCLVASVQWTENWPELRNLLLDLARRASADWVVMSDSDEHFSEAFWKGIRAKVEGAGKVNNFMVRCVNVFDGVRSEGGSKQLAFRLTDARYVGVGIGNVHEVWPRGAPYTPGTSANLPDDMFFEHVKGRERILRGSARDLFMGGGGQGVGDGNPLWRPLLKTMRHFKVTSWPEFERFIMQPGYLPVPLLEWMQKALVLSASDWGKQLRGTAEWILYHHPEYATALERELKSEPAKTQEDLVDEFVCDTYRQVLGRQADAEGRRTYDEAILSGAMAMDELPRVLMNSREYRERRQASP